MLSRLFALVFGSDEHFRKCLRFFHRKRATTYARNVNVYYMLREVCFSPMRELFTDMREAYEFNAAASYSLVGVYPRWCNFMNVILCAARRNRACVCCSTTVNAIYIITSCAIIRWAFDDVVHSVVYICATYTTHGALLFSLPGYARDGSLLCVLCAALLVQPLPPWRAAKYTRSRTEIISNLYNVVHARAGAVN